VLTTKISTFFKKYRLLISFLLIAFVFRLAISSLLTHGDLTTQAEWGGWMYKNGPKGLYDWNQWISGYWPNHPPLISLVYLWAYQFHSFLMMCFSSLGNFIALNRLAPTKFLWFFAFTKWFGEARYENTFFLKGIVLSIKFPMIIADLIIALIVYYLCKKNSVDWKKYVFAILFLPFTWYLSALWGQSDQLSFIFLIISFILLNFSGSWLSPLLFAIAVNLKPTGLILIPLYLWIWYRQRQPLKKLIFGGVLAYLFSIYIVSLFATKAPLDYLIHEIYTRVFLTIKPLIHVNSFNLWYLVNNKWGIPASTNYIFFNATTWGYIFYFFISLVSFSVIRFKKLESIFASLFISGFGGWLFMANMHERYVYAGLLSLLFLSIYKSKYFKYFIFLSTIFFINIFWAFPPKIYPFIDNAFIFYKLLSVINMVTYFIVIKMIIKDFRNSTTPAVKH
jgi:Gpi18-like mannosyltransferase